MSLHVTYANKVMLFVFNTSSPVEKYKILSVDDNEHSRLTSTKNSVNLLLVLSPEREHIRRLTDQHPPVQLQIKHGLHGLTI